MTNSPRWDEGRRDQQGESNNENRQARQQSGQSGQQGGWNDDDRRSSEEDRAQAQWNADRPGQPQQREWSAGSANRPAQQQGGASGQQGGHDDNRSVREAYNRWGAGTAPGYTPGEPSHDWGSAGARGYDNWRMPGSQGFAAGYGMSDGDNYDDRYARQRFGGASGSSNPGYGRGYGPDYGRGGSGEAQGDRGFFARAGDEIASWFGDEDAAQRREQDYRGQGPADYTRSDERIREDVNDRLTDDPRLNARQISVSVNDGEVTLNGTVSSREAKRRAEDCIDRISGVKHVQNNLRVTQGSGALNAAGTTAGTVSSAGSSSAGASPVTTAGSSTSDTAANRKDT